MYDSLAEILRLTNDGNQLSQRDLRVVELAANHGSRSSPELKRRVGRLVRKCRSGYQRPAFHGLQGLDIDQDGFVSYKGHRVEHYSQPWAYTEQGRVAARRLHARCAHLERMGKPITFDNILALGA